MHASSPRLRLLPLVLLAVLIAPVARADISIGASPAYLEMTLDPGRTSAQPILLFNSGSDPVTVKAYAWDWWHDPDNPRKFAPPGTLPNSAAKWISFVPEEATIDPGKAVNVTVVFNTPQDAKAGNYAVAWFEAIPAGRKDARELRVGARLGVLLMTEIRGRTKPEISVADFKVTPPSATELLRATFTLVNSGDVHLFPKGTLVVMSKDNKLVGHTSFEKRRLLPQQRSDVEVKWGGELAAGEYSAILTVDYGEAGAAVTTQTFTVAAPPTD